MKNNKFYDQMNQDEKRKVRSILAHHKECREEQRAILDKNIIKPISDMIKLADDVHKSKVSIQYYVKRIEDLNKHIMKFMGATE